MKASIPKSSNSPPSASHIFATSHLNPSSRICSSSLTGKKNLPNFRTRSTETTTKKTNKNGTKVSCAATQRKVNLPSHGYDYYELLGVDSKSSSREIKQAYRWLQKRCHPDVAGSIGHDMALLLNEAYSVLSDLNSRIVYDQLRVTWLEEDAFSGKPLWSTWLGHPEEDQAVFVDESQCIGCLKCAMIAGDTFAIESQHGRARAIWQWGDDEATLQDAINACPVDTIKWVEKAKLPALEYIMSQMPRVNVGLSQHSAQIRPERNVFDEAEKFLDARARKEAARQATTAGGVQESNTAAAENIRAKSGRWWRPTWQGGLSGVATWQAAQQSQGALIPLDWVLSLEEARAARSQKTSQTFFPEELRTLHEAARKRSEGIGNSQSEGKPRGWDSEEYWKPLEPISCPVNFADQKSKKTRNYRRTYDDSSSSSSKTGSTGEMFEKKQHHSFIDRLSSSIPVLTAAGAAVCVGLTGGENVAQSAPTIEGPLPIWFTSGATGQIIYAAIVWYTIGAVISTGFTFLQMYFGGEMRLQEDGKESGPSEE